MRIFHINQFGEAVVCRANETACPMEGNHYFSLEDAEVVAQTEMARRAFDANMTVKRPEIGIGFDIDGPGGNAYSILGSVERELRNHDVPQEEIEKFMEEAKSGDYEHLKQTVERWVTVLWHTTRTFH